MSNLKELNTQLVELENQTEQVRAKIKAIHAENATAAGAAGIQQFGFDFSQFIFGVGLGADHISNESLRRYFKVDDCTEIADKMVNACLLDRQYRYFINGGHSDIELTEEDYKLYTQPDSETGKYYCPERGEEIAYKELMDNMYFTYKTTKLYTEFVTPFLSN